MGARIASMLMALWIPVASGAGSVQLAWDPPTTNEDESPLTDLAGFHVYYGVSSGAYDTQVDVGLATSVSLAGLNGGETYYFTVTASDTDGHESTYSNEISRTMPDDDTTQPSVVITAPTDGSTIPKGKSLTVEAAASDEEGVAHVAIYVNGALLCADGLAPYSCRWKVPSAKNKVYRLGAQAQDLSGNVGISPVVTVTAK